MRYTKILFALLFAVTVILFTSTPSLAQDTMKKDGMTKDHMMDDKRPVVAIIAADWCPYCKRIDPVVKEVMGVYMEKMNFVMFDVTNEKTTAEAAAKAEKLGLTAFFNEYKGKTSTVAVLKDHKVVYKTSNNGRKEDYVAAFDKALK